MTINELTDLLALRIAAGRGGDEVLVSVVDVGEVVGDDVYERLSRHNWTVGGITDEARDGFVLLDLATSPN